MKLEEAIKTNHFRNEQHKMGLNILYTAWFLKMSSIGILKEFGLTHEQYNILRILNGKHPEKMCVKDIASRMIEKGSNVPRIIDRLEQKKLIKRYPNQDDGRQSLISMTTSGSIILKESTTMMDSSFDKQIKLSKSEAKQLNYLLSKITA